MYLYYQGLVLLAACIYAYKARVPFQLRVYFDAVGFHALAIFSVLCFFPASSSLYYVVYTVTTFAVLLSAAVVAIVWASMYAQMSQIFMLLAVLFCGFGGIVGHHAPKRADVAIMDLEGAAFLSLGILLLLAIGRAQAAELEFKEALVLSIHWIVKGTLSLALAWTDFRADLLEIAQVLPWATFVASAIVIGWFARSHRDSVGAPRLAN